MPRIREEFADCVIYLYRSEHEAKEGIEIGGSGFLAHVFPDHVPKPAKFIYAVTNRHVLEQKAYWVRLNTRDGRTHIDRLPAERWVKSETDDLAVCPVHLGNEAFLYKTVGEDLICSQKMAADMKLGIGDEIFMVGRFINHEGKQRNEPLLRFGHISQMPKEPVVYELEGKVHEQYSILADIRSIGGYSGSPVFFNEPDLWDRPEGSTLKPDKRYLIGVDWGHIKMWSPVCGPNEKPIGNTQVNINSGMAGLVPSWKLLELLKENDKLKKIRKEEEEKYLSALNPSKGSPDGLAVPTNGENPSGKEAFNQLLGAAVQPQKKAGRT